MTELHPLAFPRTRHVRTEDPRLGKTPYVDYKDYKPALRREFSRRCVYCRRPDEPISPGDFHVEHYRPVKLFPELERTYANLFYACARCNSRKKAYWPGTPAEEATHFLPNPCDHVMVDHVKYDGSKAVARSEAGEVAVRQLDLNEEIFVVWRARYIRRVAEWRRELKAVNARLDRIARALRSERDASRAAQLQQVQAALLVRRDELHDDLNSAAVAP